MPDVVMPRLSDSMEEGTILKWLKGNGDAVSRGEELVEIETDKATMTYEADTAGDLQIVAAEGDTLPIGALIARIGAGGDGNGTAEQAAAPTAADAELADAVERAASPAAAAAAQPAPAVPVPVPSAPAAPAAAEDGARVKASPLARRIARDLGVTLQSVRGTGPGGRVVKADVEAAAAGGATGATAAAGGATAAAGGATAAAGGATAAAGGATGATGATADVAAAAPAAPAPATAAPATAPPAAPAPAAPDTAPLAAQAAPAELRVTPGETGTSKGDVFIQEPTRGQQVVARRMAESKATIPEFTLQAEADMEECVALRAQLKQLRADGGAVPTYNDMVVKACAIALREHPRANGSYRDGRFELHSRVNVGVAVASDGQAPGEDTLVVPTVYDADIKSLAAIATDTRRLAERVRAGTITPPELSGGTFTVSNLGMFGIRSFTAVINPPQAAILAVGSLAERAVVRDGQLVVRNTMSITLTCDHRILYGAGAALFLARVRELLQQPLALAF